MDLILETIRNFPLFFGYILYALTLSVTIIVVAVPEGLPMMITLVLSSNMKRMLKNNVLVRKMVGIETAGSLNVLFTDKTGTLTKGKLEVVGFLSASGREYKSEIELFPHEIFHEHLKNSCIYNNSSTYNDKKCAIGGNITDRAVLEFITTDATLQYPKVDQIPFDSRNKYSSVVIDNGKKIHYIKGAPEKLLSHCTSYLSETGRKIPLTNRDSFASKINAATKNGIRVILLAMNDSFNYKEIEHLTLLGAFYIKDDIRKEAILGIQMVKDAGIHTVMITGDNVDTATSIGKEVGLLTSPTDVIITSDQ